MAGNNQNFSKWSSPDEIRVWQKAKADVCESNKVGMTPNDEVPVEKIIEEGSDFNKKGISAEEATKFLRIIQ